MKLFIKKNSLEDEFLGLLELVKKQLYQTAFAILKNETDALDAVSETVCKAYGSYSSLREKSLWKTWITRILINHCNDVYKKKKNMISLEEAPELIQYNDTTSFSDACATFSIEDMIKILPEEQRNIILMRFVSDLPLKDIAAVLNLPLGTVKTKLYSGLEKLRVEYQEDFINEAY